MSFSPAALNLVYIDGKPSQKLTNDNLVDELNG